MLVEIKELVGGLQKDEPSKTNDAGEVQLDSSKTKSYLNSLAEFIHSGYNEAATRRAEFERKLSSDSSYSSAGSPTGWVLVRD